MTDGDGTDLMAQLAAAREERLACLARGDGETAALLAAWIDALLDEWNSRTA